MANSKKMNKNNQIVRGLIKDFVAREEDLIPCGATFRSSFFETSGILRLKGGEEKRFDIRGWSDCQYFDDYYDVCRWYVDVIVGGIPMPPEKFLKIPERRKEICSFQWNRDLQRPAHLKWC